MIYLLFILNVFAHEDLGSTKCSSDKEMIRIEKQKDHTYKIKTPDMKAPKFFKAPDVADTFDPKHKQVFDTYSFVEKGLDLVVKRPETKGPIKKKFALWKNKKYDCL